MILSPINCSGGMPLAVSLSGVPRFIDISQCYLIFLSWSYLFLRALRSKPFSMLPLATKAMLTRPSQTITKNSGGQNIRTTGRTMGISITSTTNPKMAPSAHAIAANPKALPASPLWAIEYSTRHVATIIGVPGVLRRIAGIDPPKAVAPCIPAII